MTIRKILKEAISFSRDFLICSETAFSKPIIFMLFNCKRFFEVSATRSSILPFHLARFLANNFPTKYTMTKETKLFSGFHEKQGLLLTEHGHDN